MDKTDCIVIGAGVIGLAVARAVARRGGEVLVLEKEEGIGTHTSSRNSEVIHAGLYYPQDSLKADLCVRGKFMLYDYCTSKGVQHRRIGKLVVATDPEQVSALENLYENAAKNGVDDLEMLDADEARKLEPSVRCVRGMLSPSTGIISSHELMLALQGDLEDAGGMVVLDTAVTGITAINGGFEVETGGDFSLRSTQLINAAGPWAQELAASIDVLDAQFVPDTFLAKGHYFTYAGKSPFRRLVYPMPNNAGLGTHVTLDTAGGVRLGPDVCWVPAIDYTFDESRRDDFCESVRQFFPGLDVDRLQPGYTGIRPKIVGPDAPSADFVIQGEDRHGVPGLVNLFGIESPGLTSSLAIAETVSNMLTSRQASEPR